MSTVDPQGQPDVEDRLAALLLSFRAENLRDELFDMFTEPDYFPALQTRHPCFLIGGRGTGKTTTLRSLSYRGQYQLRGGDLTAIGSWPLIGLYFRVDTNRVTAFSGLEVSEERWIRLFGHYINLALSSLLLEFLSWYMERREAPLDLNPTLFDEFAVSIHLEPDSTLEILERQVLLELRRFEAFINNIGAEQPGPPLSLQGAPLEALYPVIASIDDLRDLPIAFLVDEYENLLDYQQRAFNTLVKHPGPYTFKVGMKELGHRQRTTLNPEEQLIHPADYHRIDIVDELRPRFSGFAEAVCNRRLQQVATDAVQVPESLASLFPELSLEEEAILLGVEGRLDTVERELALDELSEEAWEWLKEISCLERFALWCRSRSAGQSVKEVVEFARDDPTAWKRHYENYKYAYLFAVRPSKRGIRKYYAGWSVFCLMAGGNIRYLLELVQRAFTIHRSREKGWSESIDYSDQTKAAADTGRKNLQELEGLSIHGARLTHLLLSLGRVFQVLAEDPIGHAPEINQFTLRGSDEEGVDSNAQELVEAAVMHLALLRFPASKLQTASDVKGYDYSIHPIFAAFFGFSHRRKRKIVLTTSDVWHLTEDPRDRIPAVLARLHRVLPEELPAQLRLFEGFFSE